MNRRRHSDFDFCPAAPELSKARFQEGKNGKK
jgi:hypothetical protein